LDVNKENCYEDYYYDLRSFSAVEEVGLVPSASNWRVSGISDIVTLMRAEKGANDFKEIYATGTMDV